jgi:hypothetical protein
MSAFFFFSFLFSQATPPPTKLAPAGPHALAAGWLAPAAGLSRRLPLASAAGHLPSPPNARPPSQPDTAR